MCTTRYHYMYGTHPLPYRWCVNPLHYTCTGGVSCGSTVLTTLPYHMHAHYLPSGSTSHPYYMHSAHVPCIHTVPVCIQYGMCTLHTHLRYTPKIGWPDGQVVALPLNMGYSGCTAPDQHILGLETLLSGMRTLVVATLDDTPK